MKKLFTSLLPLFLISCSPNIPENMDGNWVISEMEFNETPIYPKTISNKIQIELNVLGSEHAEKLEFKNNTTVAKLPGFGSDKILVDCIKNKNHIEFSINDTDYSDESFQLAKQIFKNKYTIEKGAKKGEFILKSNTTLLKIIDEKVLMENRVNDVFNGF